MSGTSSTDLPRVTRQDADTFIVLAPGCVDEVASQLGRLGRKRAYVVTGSTLASGRVGQRIRSELGSMMVGTFSGARPHVPVETAEQVANEVRSLNANVIIGLGGGSPIGTAKAAVSRLAGGATAGDNRWMVAAIPTTYSGSEVTPVFGTTDVAHGRKEVVRNPGIRPRLVLYDPELAVDTPANLTAGTGINALAHCVEGLYSSDAGDEEQAMAVHHGLCHVLGGRYNAPHGMLNAIILPHAMRFNLPVAGPAYAQLAPVFGLKAADSPRTGQAVCRALTDFIRQFRLPYRLRELGIPKSDLPAVAADALQSQSVRRNPRPLRDAGDALQILEAAW